LLLWALQTRRQQDEIDIAVLTLIANGALNRKPKPSLESWDLFEYIEVAASLNIIRDETAIQTRLAKDFRNLIHPGRANRLAQKCDRATAYGAITGVLLVVRDL
jgi:hypothetical protein